MRNTARVSILGSLAVLLGGCAYDTTIPAGTTAYLIAPDEHRVAVMVPADQERWKGGRLAWFADGTKVVLVGKPAAGSPAPTGLDAAEPQRLVRVVVVAGPHEGVEILVPRPQLGGAPRRTRQADASGAKVFVVALLTTIGAAGCVSFLSWFRGLGRMPASRHWATVRVLRVGSGRLHSSGSRIARDDERWLSWLRGLTARRDRRERCYVITR